MPRRLYTPATMLPFIIVNCRNCVIEALLILEGIYTTNNLTIENFLCILSSHLHDNSVLGAWTFEKVFQSAYFWKQYCYCLYVNYKNANLLNSDVMRVHIKWSACRNVQRCLVFLYKVTLSATGLACIIQRFLSYSQICDRLTMLSSVCIFSPHFLVHYCRVIMPLCRFNKQTSMILHP